MVAPTASGMTRGPIFSRRHLLRAGLVAGGAVILGGTGTVLALRGRAPRVPRLRCLTDHQYWTLSQLALALFPEGEGFPRGARDIDLARRFDDFLADEPEWNRADLKLGLTLLEFGPLVFAHRLTSFSRLGSEERLAHFESWAEGSVVQRQVALALKKFLSLVFYDRPEVWPAIGYDGPVVETVAR